MSGRDALAETLLELLAPLGPVQIRRMFGGSGVFLDGLMFGLVVGRLRWRGATVVIAGAVYGVMVFAISSWIALPLAGSIFSSGDQIKNMAQMVGYGTFVVEHILFGLSLGVLFAVRGRSRS